MKKLIVGLVFLVIYSLFFNSCKEFKKNKSNNSISKEYQNHYCDSTLANTILPVLMPYNKIINPVGKQIYFGDPGLENHALDCALSPDNKTLAVEGRYSIIFINTSTNKIKYRLRLRDNKNYKHSLNTYSGIKWYKKSNKLYVFWSNASAKKSISNVIMALWDGSKAHIVDDFSFIAEKPARTALPNELEILKENGKDYLYVVLNGNNKIVKINIKTKKIIWQKNSGMVPYGIVIANDNIYVTNWGGFKPAKNDTNVAGAPWDAVKIDTKTSATSSGSVSVINPKNGKLIKEIKVGLHPNDIIKSPDEKFVYVANANSDDVSVINTQTNKLSETISVRLLKEKNPFYGDSPNGLGITSDGACLFVANGMDNALAVVKLGKNSFSNGKRENSKVIGFIPTEAYPGAVTVLNDSILYVANIEAEGARETIITGENDAFKTFHKELPESTNRYFNSHRMLASVSVIPLPDTKALKKETAKVIQSNNMFRLELVKLLPRKNVTPVPVPERIGEPSVFKHVIYIIKENRTYDQVLGDMKEGRGESLLCAFGKKITPNTHKLSKDFLLMDNYYVSGKCSAEGHQWTDASIVTDYIEKNVRAWFRNYPHVQTDAMVYHKTGFIWDNALDHNKTVRIYGEAAIPEWSTGKRWKDIYKWKRVVHLHSYP
jgi:YVTN family beta-propeller protein